MHPRAIATMAFLLSLAGLAPAAGAAISFQWINDLPGGDVFVHVGDVSADGTAVVGTSHTAAGNRAFRWTAAGGTVALPPPSGVPAGAQVAEGRAVSGDGSVVVGPYNVPANIAYRWTSAGGTVSLGIADGEAPFERTTPVDISRDGSVVLAGHETSLERYSVRWTAGGGWSPLTDPGGAVSAIYAWAISDDGQVAGGENLGAVRWTAAGGAAPLPAGPNEDLRVITALSADGSIAVGAGRLFNDYRPFRWSQSSGITWIPDLVAASDGQALDVSADGSIVVGHAGGAFVWDAVNGTRSLQALVEGEGINLNGWTLDTADAISADGRTIAGQALLPFVGERRGFVVTIPEPASSLCTAALAALAALGRRRREKLREDR